MKNITIAGRIGKDAETRNTQSGDQVTGFTVAVDEGYGDKKRTFWFDVSMWGKRGASLAPYLTKGSNITVCGELSDREYNGKTYYTIRASDVSLQGGRSEGGQSSGGYERKNEPANHISGAAPDLEDEVPF